MAVAIVDVVISNNDRGVPFVLLLMIASLLVLTFVAKRTTFGRHVYAVGGNAEAARRAGINVARVRVIVFMISGAMAGLGGVVLAARLNSVDLNAGGGTLLIDAIAAAVIGGTSLFGGRGEVRDALFGALVIATIANGLNTLNLTQGVIFITTGGILLFAVTLDTVLRRRQRAPAADLSNSLLLGSAVRDGDAAAARARADDRVADLGRRGSRPRTSLRRERPRCPRRSRAGGGGPRARTCHPTR